METVEHIEDGRKYLAHTDGEHAIIIGPPEGLVDDLKLPEPFATDLHNILYARRLYSYSDILARPKELQGALQEALLLDVQRLTEAYFKSSQEAKP